jgi:ABC-type glycerol-3-phosphate transport system permease component
VIARLGPLARAGILTVAAAAAFVPLLYMLLTALRSSREYADDPLGLPTQPHLSNFSDAIGTDIGRWFVNSVLVTAGSVTLVAVLAVLAAYGLVRLPFPGSRLLLNLLVWLMVLPPVVMLIPLFTTMNSLGLANSLLSVILAYTGLMFPFSVFLMSRFIDTVPDELYEAAAVDGASHLRIVWSVVVPIARPALITLGVVNALWAWNELLIAVVLLQHEGGRTLQAGLALLQGRNTTNVPLVMAGATLSVAPMIALYLAFQRQLREGILAGALKG